MFKLFYINQRTERESLDWQGSLEELIENGFFSDGDEVTLYHALSMKDGEEIRYGGGAAPLMVLRKNPVDAWAEVDRLFQTAPSFAS
jgi:hypothetical protein